MRSSPRIIYSVRYDRGAWWIFIGTKKVGPRARTKAEAIAEGREAARQRAGVDRTVTQLRVFNKNGRISFEHTYPRSSDPKDRVG